MPDEQSVLQAVIVAPDDDAPRLTYADWFDGRGTPPPDPRGEFIRLQLTLRRIERDGLHAPDRKAEVRTRLAWLQDSEREAAIREQFAAEWARPVARLTSGYTFDRGFIGSVALTASDFLSHADRLLALAPIVHVELRDVALFVEPLFACSHLARIRALSLSDSGLNDDDMRRLAESPHLQNVWWLDLSFNDIGPPGVETLATSTCLKNVTFLSLKSNPSDPRETLAFEGELISDATLPPEGKALEARHGYIPWLHCHAESAVDYPPNPLDPPLRP